MVRGIGIIAALLLSLTVIAGAQNPSLKFDVASIKPAASGRPGMSIQTEPGRFKAINATVSFLIQYAYNIRDFQLSGGPGWMGSDTFDIDATGENADYRQFPLMMGSLLADRFQLKFHRETRTLPVYDLVVAKDGPKLKSASATATGGTRNSSGQITISKGTVAGLASLLSNILGRKVLDKTGLTGDYDMALKWTPDDYQPPPLRPNAPPPDPNSPSIFTALQEQLGLKLESSKGPVEVIVVDSVQKPSEN
jgi:uncharacterized protein (TIGR03435 family)